MGHWGMHRRIVARWTVGTLLCVMAGGAWSADGPLRVLRISPSGTHIQPAQEAVIQFDRTMVELGHMGRKASELPVTIRPDPGCEWRWLNTSELVCRLSGQRTFMPATEYTIKVSTALTALDGSRLAEPVTETFTTWLPTLRRAEFQVWESPVMPVLTVLSNLPVTAKELAAHVAFIGPDEQRVAIKVEPFTKKREGPLWLPVPGAPGALILVEHPMPDTPLDVKASAEAGRRVWQIRPVAPLAAGTGYDLRVSPGLRTTVGALPGTQDQALGGVATYGDFAFQGIECYDQEKNTWVSVGTDEKDDSRCRPGTVELHFSSPVVRATLAAVTWQPPIMPRAKLAAHWRDYPDGYFSLPANPKGGATGASYPLDWFLQPMADYHVGVPAGVKDQFGRTLAKPAAMAFQTGHRPSMLENIPEWTVLEAGQKTIAPLWFTNLDKLLLDYRVLTPLDLASGWKPGPVQSEDLLKRLSPTEDQIFRGNLGARGWLHGGSGVAWGALRYRYRQDQPNYYYRNYDRRSSMQVEVTPWQVLAKVGHYDSLVWVNRLDNGSPVAGAKVRLWGSKQATLDGLAPIGPAVTTDANGAVDLPGVVDLPEGRFYSDSSRYLYLSAVRGDDMALLPLNWDFDRSPYGNTRPRYGHLRAWAVTTQGIYRPDSDVNYAAFVRQQGPTQLLAPPALDYTLTIDDPQGNKIVERKQVKLSAFGEVTGSMHVSANAPMGWYSIRLQWKDGKNSGQRLAGRFMVADFVPSAFKVRTLVKGQRFAPGDTVTTDASATLHAGGPYTFAKVKFTTRLLNRWFAPATPLASGFSFGNAEGTIPKDQTLATTNGMLDGAGHAQTSVKLPTDSKIVYGEVSVEAAVESSRGTWVASAATVPFAAVDRFVGLRTRDWVQTAEKPFDVQYLVVDPDGNPAADSKVDVRLEERVITRVKVKNGAGEFVDQEHADWVARNRCKATSTAEPATCQLTPPKAGDYRVVAAVTDTRGHVQTSAIGVWVTGAGEVVWSTESGQGVTLVPDKARYEIGDTAHVLVQNPYPGANALVTVERYGILWKKFVKLEGSAPVIDVPITQSAFPGAFLSVAIFSPRVSPPADPDLGRPELALGYLTLKVSGKGSYLTTRVLPAKAQYKPGETVEVDVAVDKDKSVGGGAAGKVRLVAAVVDQGVVDLLENGKQYYDATGTFFAPPSGPDVRNFSLVNRLVTRLQPKLGKGENPGGGGGESAGPNVRSNFAYAAYWNPALETGDDGHAHFSFKLPDNLTRWRILVMAIGPSDKMGLGDGSVQVNLPIQIEPALPNQVRAGDRFEAAFNVTNRTQQKQAVSTSIHATGAIEGGTAAASHEFSLASFGHDLAWLPLVAADPGTIHFEAVAKAGPLGDAVTASVPVKSPATEVVAAEYGSTTGPDADVPIKVPAEAVPGSAKVAVRFAPTLVGGLNGAFEVLRTDPLETWEIRLSRGVLASDYLRLKPVLGNSFNWPDADATIDRMFRSAADFQAPSGGMAFWIPRELFVSKYLSAYTLLAFDWLRAAGHVPPATVEQKLADYVRRVVLRDRSLDLRVAAMAALALSPKPGLPKDAAAGLIPELPKLELFSQSLLLETAMALDDRPSADVIAKSILGHAEESAGEISFNERVIGEYFDFLSTPLRSNCAILDALSQYKVKYGEVNLVGTVPQKSMRWVSGQRRNAGGWPNSQENVFCTTATVHYADAYETPVTSLTGVLALPGRAPQSTTFTARSNPAVELAGPVAKAGERLDVKLRHGGEGRLYYGVALHYAMPPDLLPAADAGMTLSRHYYVQRAGQWKEVTSDTRLTRGEIVQVTLDVDAPTMRHHVVLTDPLPGTFEAVNRQLATSIQVAPSHESDGVAVLMFDGGAWPNMEITVGGFYHREMAFDAVRFFAEDLPAGHYRLVYAAQVIAPGTFIAPAPQVKEIYQPDVFGRGVPTHLHVVLPKD